MSNPYRDHARSLGIIARPTESQLTTDVHDDGMTVDVVETDDAQHVTVNAPHIKASLLLNAQEQFDPPPGNPPTGGTGQRSPWLSGMRDDFRNRGWNPGDLDRFRMAVTASGMFLPTWLDILDTTQLAVDLDLETHKVAMFTNSITPNFSTNTAYAVSPYDANEVSGTGYTAGGTALTTTTVTESPTGSIMFDAADTAWTTSTITNARCALIYADALAGNNAIVLVNFGADYSTSAGTFTIQWAAAGLLALDITP